MKDRCPTYYLGKDFRKTLKEFVDRFLEEGLLQFSSEFVKIDDYVARSERDITDRDDHSLRHNPKEMYLLEVTAFKIYDEINRDAFNKAANTLIVMPDCLSLHNPECEKVDAKYSDVCKKCTVTCQAYQITELAKKYGAMVVFSKRKLEEQLQHFSDKSGDLGVIGVACIMMLANGMRTAREVGVPARGVLLNCTGCEHWNEQPFASPFTMEWLEEILKEKYESRNQTPDRG